MTVAQTRLRGDLLQIDNLSPLAARQKMSPNHVSHTLLLTAICACVLVGILVAGLWPFHAPRNEVSWLSQGNGLLFGKRGSIVTTGTFEANRSRADSSC